MGFFRLVLFAFVMLIFTSAVYADGDSWEGAGAAANEISAVQPPNTPTLGIDEKLSGRLPPMLPGQEVQVGGKKMKVWTSSGPVPVAQPPEPWNEDEQTLREVGPGIIVDQRKRR